MPRETYQLELQDLQDQMMLLGHHVDRAVERAIDTLVRLDAALARQVIDDDAAINRKRFQIEEQAINLIATQQPVASDLRLIVAIINNIVDLERIGDYAVGIAKVTLLHEDKPLLKPLIDIPRMADHARDMLTRALTAFVAIDVQTAREIAREDDFIDALYDQIYRELLTYMLNDPRAIDRATWLLWVAHNLERVADRVTNICERTVYRATGEMSEIRAAIR
jgi:phosphate transport system protein